MHVATFDQLGIAKFCPKQDIINVVTKFKETKYVIRSSLVPDYYWCLVNNINYELGLSFGSPVS